MNEKTSSMKRKRLIGNIFSYVLLVLISIICDHWESFRHRAPEFSQGVVRAAAYIDRNFRRPVRLDELARTADMAKNTLLRNFRRATGCTPMEYLLRRRLARACGMLMQTTLRINEIAAECGFADTAYFTRVFRKKMGCTAGEYRRGEHRQEIAAPSKSMGEVPPPPPPVR